MSKKPSWRELNLRKDKIVLKKIKRGGPIELPKPLSLEELLVINQNLTKNEK